MIQTMRRMSAVCSGVCDFTDALTQNWSKFNAFVTLSCYNVCYAIVKYTASSKRLQRMSMSLRQTPKSFSP